MNSYELDKMDYERIQSKFDSHMFQVAAFHGLQLSELRWKHHFDFALDQFNIYYEVIDSKQFPIFTKKVSGRTDIIERKAIISVKREDVRGRMIFTSMHELVHALFHYEINSKGEYVKKVSTEESKLEVEADIGASLFMAHDDTIDDYLTNGVTFNQMRYFLDYSAKGLHARLINYLEHTSHLTKYEAKRIVFDYRFYQSGEIVLANEYSKEFRYEMHRELMSQYVTDLNIGY